MTEETDCQACLDALQRIEVQHSKFNEQLRMLNGNFMKIVYAMFALIGANVGTKYIGTPILVYCGVYAAILSAIFVLLITVAKWRCLNFWERWIRLSFVSYVVWVSGLRIYSYQAGMSLTQNQGIFANMSLIILALGFIMLAWRRDSMRQKKKRRYTDV